MKLSRTLAAPLALSFTLAAALPVLAEPTNDNDLGQPFTCEAEDVSSLSIGDIVNSHMLPASVFIQTGNTVISDGSGFENFLQDFFQQSPDVNSVPLSGSGSGFVVDGDQGYIVTNNHVVDGSNVYFVTLFDPNELDYVGETFNARLVGVDPETDVAVLQIDAGRSLDCVVFADSDDVRVMDPVVAIGNPLGQPFSTSAGIVSHTMRTSESPYTNYIQTDASINSGNSGGPLFNYEGEVVGVNSMIISRSGGSNGIGFAIEADTVEYVAGQIILHGEVDRGWLGIQMQQITEQRAAALGMVEPDGVYVAEVMEGSPAEAAGLQDEDVILSFNGVEVDTTRELLQAVGMTPVGENAEVVVLRDGVEMTLEATLSSRLDAMAVEEPAEELDQQPETPAPAPAPLP